jgi:hypothetical protein
MPGAVCKAAICGIEAQAKIDAAYDTIEQVKHEEPELQIKISEMYISSLNDCTKKVIDLIS